MSDWKEGQPCNHKGCLNHVTHPCEGCGRIEGRRVDWKAQLAKDLYLETMDVAWTDDIIIQYALAVSKAIESNRRCGECEKRNKKLHLDWKSPDNKYCKSLEMFTAKDFFCADFEPKKENSDE